jgi:hypothetical protein
MQTWNWSPVLASGKLGCREWGGQEDLGYFSSVILILQRMNETKILPEYLLTLLCRSTFSNTTRWDIKIG